MILFIPIYCILNRDISVCNQNCSNCKCDCCCDYIRKCPNCGEIIYRYDSCEEICNCC